MIASSVIPHGPYRATKLWNEVVSIFRAGMPVKKHRQRFKLHHDCFTGLDAVEWLHALLKANPNFSLHVSRKQTLQLLNKFLKNHIIEDVHGQWGEETFSENGQLFRFPMNNSPVKRFRQPLKAIKVNENVTKSQNRLNDKISPNSNILKETNHQAKKKISSPKTKLVTLDQASPEQIRKRAFTTCFRRILHLDKADESTLKLDVNTEWLMRNTSSRDDSGLVMVPSHDELPCWVLSAMKCLSNWPDNVDTGLPNYEGFEKDVFKAISDYFQSLPEPLLTYQLFQVFATALIRCEVLDQICSGYTHSVVLKDAPSKDSPADASDRIHKQLMQAQMRHENLALRRQRSQKKKKKQLFPEEVVKGPCRSTSQAAKGRSGANMGGEAISYPSRLSLWNSPDPILDDVEEETAHKTMSSRSGGFRAFPSFTASIESLPAMNDGNMHENLYNFRRQPSTFKSEGNLLGLRENPSDCLEETEEIFSSVEDLLLNMSITAPMEADPSDVYGGGKEVKSALLHPTYSSQFDSFDLKRRETATLKTKNRLKQLDGLATRPKILKPSLADNSAAAANSHNQLNQCYPHSEAAFSVYHKMRSDHPSESLKVDEYATLPWHLNRRNSKVIVRSKTRNKNAASRNTWYGGEVFRSKSDIIARREVPPTVGVYDGRNGSKYFPQPAKIPHVRSTASDLGFQDDGSRSEAMNYRRLSKSYANLPDPQPHETQLVTKPVTHHRSMELLSEARKPHQSQSPLSAALEQARVNLKTIAAKNDKQTHTVEAFQLCLLLLPPANRRKLHLLLRLMTKMLTNDNLADLDDRMSTRELLIDHFTDAIFRPSEQPDCATKRISERVVACLLDNASIVMKTNEDFLQEQQKLTEAEQNDAEANQVKRKLKKQFTFCNQVSQSEYESHNGTTLETALTDLLHAIVNDEKISIREKRKKLKQFQKSYPHIYNAEFPLGDPIANEKKPRLGGALRKLKSLRI